MKTAIEIPDECANYKTCVFNRGSHGYCLCYEHYSIRHGKDKAVIDAYFNKYPERKTVVETIQI